MSKPTEAYTKVLWESPELICYEICTRNDVLGDMAAEWMDKEDWKNWELYLWELEMRGTRGELTVKQLTLTKHPEFDRPQQNVQNLSSYRFVILDLSEKA